MFTVYALFNRATSKLYIGQTQNLSARLRAHNNKFKTKSYTARFEGEWEVVHQELFATRSEAIGREKQLKSHQGRSYLQQFIPKVS